MHCVRALTLLTDISPTLCVDSKVTTNKFRDHPLYASLIAHLGCGKKQMKHGSCAWHIQDLADAKPSVNEAICLNLACCERDCPCKLA